MPTSSRPRAGARPRPAAGTPARAGTTTARATPREHSEWQHGPVAAAINAGLVSLLAAAVIRLLHLAPGWPLLAGVVMSMALTANGVLRKPRRLAGRSLIYRSTAMLTAGVWVWERSVDFSHVGPGGVAGMSILFVSAGTAALTWTSWRTGHRRVALVASATSLATLIAGGITAAVAHVGTLLVDAASLNRGNYQQWLVPSALTMAVAAAAFAVVGTACANHEHELDAMVEAALMRKDGGRQQVKIQALLRELTRQPELRIVGMTRWANGAGEDYEIDGSGSGTTRTDLIGHLDTLAARLNLPEGCGVEVRKGGSRGRLILAVSRVNKLSEDFPYPRKYEMQSVYNGILLGRHRDASETRVRIRENSMFVWGQKRSGKTTTLYTLIAGLHQCTDALIWVIDLGGGGAALPFLYAYAEGRVSRPGIDWVATTIGEVDKMATLALKLAKDRKAFYQHRKRAGNTTLLPLDSEVPEVVIVIDEGAELMGANAGGGDYAVKQAREKIEELVRIAGDAGFNVVLSGLAATGEVVDRLILAQVGIRVGMRVSDSRELAYGFDDYSLDPDDIPYQGSGFARVSHGEPARPYRGCAILPDQMDEIAVVTAPWRPELDKRGQELGGTIYAQRWARTQHLLRDESGNVLVDVDEDAPTQALPARPAGAERPTVPVPAATPDTGDADEELRKQFPLAPPPMPAPTREELAGVGNYLDGLPAVDDRSPEEMMAEVDARLHEMGDVDDPHAADIAEFRTQLDSVLADPNSTAMWEDPTKWEIPPAPPGLEEKLNPGGAEILEALVRSYGTEGIRAKDIKDLLPRGGSWGPAVRVSAQTMHNWLAPPPDRNPAPWLADRRKGKNDPYVHRDAR